MDISPLQTDRRGPRCAPLGTHNRPHLSVAGGVLVLSPAPTIAPTIARSIAPTPTPAPDRFAQAAAVRSAPTPPRQAPRPAVRRGYPLFQAVCSRVSATTCLGSRPPATSASVTRSSTERMLARSAIHTTCSDSADPA